MITESNMLGNKKSPTNTKPIIGPPPPMSNHESYKKYANLDFELPIPETDMREMVDEYCKQMSVEANKQVEEQFVIVLKQAVLSGDFVNVCLNYNSKIIYAPYMGIQALRNRFDLAKEILEKHGLLEEFENAEKGENK